MSAQVLLIVELAAKPGHEQEVLAALVAMETASRAEDGCLEYSMLRSLSAPLRFVVYEVWQSAEHLERHRETAHYRAFGPVVERLFSRPPALFELPLPAGKERA